MNSEKMNIRSSVKKNVKIIKMNNKEFILWEYS